MADVVPGKLELDQTYNDTWRGWPVRPHDGQHPIRGSFLDPRPDPNLGAIYHDGVDIGVRDDQPESGAPRGRTHRVYAIEGGRVTAATGPGVRGLVDAGHFRYEHVEALVHVGDTVQPGQLIGWTWFDSWHVHLGEFVFAPDGRRLLVNPLRRGGKLHPYVDTEPPAIEEIRFYEPATPSWARRPGTTVALLPQAGRRLDKTRLAGAVDVRVRLNDPQSFIGWFRDLPWLAAPHHPHRVELTLVQRSTGRVVFRRDAFRSEQMIELPAGQHYAPGTEQNLPANACMQRHGTMRCDGIYWFRLVPRPYLDTRRLANGRYRLRVLAWDIVGNEAEANTEITLAN